MIQQNLIRCDLTHPNDPERCDSVHKTSQCQFKVIPGTKKCPMHQIGQVDQNKEQVRNYRLTKWRQRVNEFADSSQVKSLREEIGILRIILEEILNKCHDTEDLLLYSTKISDHILKIEKLVKSCHQLEFATGALLDKTTILQIAAVIVEISSQYVQDPLLLDEMGDKIITMITESKINLLEEKSS